MCQADSFIAPLWQRRIYAHLDRRIDPWADRELFRNRATGFTGSLDFWAIPSPEPALPASLIERLQRPQPPDGPIALAGATLAATLQRDFQPENLLLVAILRAGLPVAAWLSQMLPGSIAVATSLFVGWGIDVVSLRRIEHEHAGRKIIFVDG